MVESGNSPCTGEQDLSNPSSPQRASSLLVNNESHFLFIKAKSDTAGEIVAALL